MTALQERYAAAVESQEARPAESISAYRDIILSSTKANDAESVKVCLARLPGTSDERL